MIMTAFAGLWCALGIRMAQVSVFYFLPVALICLALFWLARKQTARRPNQPTANGRLVGIASAVEGLLIFIAINVLQNIGRPNLITPAVAVIVGLHFWPLARWLPARGYYLTGAALVVVGAAGLLVPDPGARALVVSLAAAGVLWLTSLWVLTKMPAVN